MRQFLGSQTNRIDAKGRVSIPATFRAALRDADGNTALILRPSSRRKCIEGWPTDLFHALATPTDKIDPFDDALETRVMSFFGRAQVPQVDREGRMMLPPDLARHAGIADELMFIGLGRWFQIWEPGLGEQRLAEAEGAR
jgi:MraZ protein